MKQVWLIALISFSIAAPVFIGQNAGMTRDHLLLFVLASSANAFWCAMKVLLGKKGYPVSWLFGNQWRDIPNMLHLIRTAQGGKKFVYSSLLVGFGNCVDLLFYYLFWWVLTRPRTLR